MRLGTSCGVGALVEKQLVFYVVVYAHEDSAWNSKPALKVGIVEHGRLAVDTPVVAQNVAPLRGAFPLLVRSAPTNRPAVPSPFAVTAAEPLRQLQQPKMTDHRSLEARGEAFLLHRTAHVGCVHELLLLVVFHGLHEQRKHEYTETHRLTIL